MNTLDVMRKNFLADICEHPDDDAPRLIYADWLDDNGDSARAEFIRVQCRIAALDRELESDDDCEEPTCPGCAERRPLRQRELELQGSGRRWWSDYGPGDKITVLEWRRGFVHRLACTCAAWLEHGPAIVRQQPVQRVELSDKASTWGVRPPYPSGWLRQLDFPSGEMRLDELPYKLFDCLKNGPLCRLMNPNWFGCDSDAAALDALSAAAIRYAIGSKP